MTRGLLTNIATVVAKTGLTPNMLTWLGFAVSGVTGLALSRGAFAAGGILVLVAGVFDALDGSVARVTGRVSKFGAFLDSTLDRIAEIVTFLGLLVYFAGQGDGRQQVALIYLAVAGSLMVSYARARAEGVGYECKVGLFTRLERVLVLSLGLIFGLVHVALWMIAVGSWLTAFHRMWHVWQEASR
jgi:CDP-diacylglycerol--glycerol-3-phosphate 3-phosphatidyltransferase